MESTIMIGLLVVAVLLLVGLTALVLQRGKVEPKDIEPAITKACIESGLDRSVGELTAYARDTKETHRSVEQMLRVPKERASL